MAAASPKPERRYLRIGELAERAGVAVATIKYYIREGLLPPAPIKTGRTMAYYDEAYLERLRLVRSLREEHFLPVKVIRAVLAEREGPLDAKDRELLARAAPGFLARLAAMAGAAATRAELLAESGVSDDDLATLEEMGLVGEPEGDGGARRYGADDRALLGALKALDDAGVSRDRFPLEDLGHHVELLGELSRREVRTFVRRASDLDAAELQALAARALALTEPILVLVRKKLIQRALRAELSNPRPEEEP